MAHKINGKRRSFLIQQINGTTYYEPTWVSASNIKGKGAAKMIKDYLDKQNDPDDATRTGTEIFVEDPPGKARAL